MKSALKAAAKKAPLILALFFRAIDWRTKYFLGFKPLYQLLNEKDAEVTPTKFILPMFGVIVLIQAAFALIYLIPDERTSTYLVHVNAAMGTEQKVISFLDALYFSGVTLFTVGYGDILPKGGFRFIAMAEFYAGTLVVFALFAFGVGIFANHVHHESRVQRKDT